jgi:flagellar basal body-associated protein FliL
MASPLKREVSPVVAAVIVIVVLALVAGAYWYLAGGSAISERNKGPARPLEPPPNLMMPQGAGPAGAPQPAPR